MLIFNNPLLDVPDPYSTTPENSSIIQFIFTSNSNLDENTYCAA